MSALVFLDFDGVILPWNLGSSQPSPEAVKAINHLIKALGAQIVVSSAWRKGRSPSLNGSLSGGASRAPS